MIYHQPVTEGHRGLYLGRIVKHKKQKKEKTNYERNKKTTNCAS